MTGRRPAVILALAGLMAAGWLLWRLAYPPAAELPAACPSPAFLAHRANGVAAAAAAAGRGFCGVEVDVHWRAGFGLVVSHDELPADWSPAGALGLNGLLDSLPALPPLLWLDFKDLSPDNAADAAAHLDSLLVRHRLAGRVIVEARDPAALWLLYRRVGGVLPAYWVPPRPSGLRRVWYDVRLALAMSALGFPAISVSKTFLTPEFARRFGRYALFTWTCNTPAEMRRAAELGARVVLSDEDPPR